MIIDAPTSKDFSAIAELVNKTTRTSFIGHYHPDVIEHKASFTTDSVAERVNVGKYFVARDEDKIVGVVGLVEEELKTFFVDEMYQGRGLGMELLNKIENEAKNQGLARIWLKSSIPAIPFYESQGFKITEQYQKEAAGHSYLSSRMEKSLV